MSNQEAMHAIAEAYGWLWHMTTTDCRAHAARRLLRDLLDKDMRAYGITAAKGAGAMVGPTQIRHRKGDTANGKSR